MAVRKVDWRQRRYGQIMRKMSQKSRQVKTIPQTSGDREKGEKWREEGIDKTWCSIAYGLGIKGT